MELSPSLFHLEESRNVSKAEVRKLADEFLEKLKERVEASKRSHEKRPVEARK